MCAVLSRMRGFIDVTVKLFELRCSAETDCHGIATSILSGVELFGLGLAGPRRFYSADTARVAGREMSF